VPSDGASVAAPIRSQGGHAWSYDDTEGRLASVLERVPITRVYDATALDRLGLPVWGAVTPLARDLTVHAGKGQSAQAARISATMEAIERVCAEDIDPARIRRASFQELLAEDPYSVLDPAGCDLPFDTLYRPSKPCAWVRGNDLYGADAVWVALDLVLSPAREGVCRGPDTNGLAAGNTLLEASLHGLYEVIERDAAAQRNFRRSYGEGDSAWALRVLEPGGVPEGVAAWIDRLHTCGIAVTLEDLTHDVGLPVFRASLSDRSFPGREGQAVDFEGFGCDLDPAQALQRAVCEAVQSHTAVLLGARESFEGGHAPAPSSARLFEWLLAPSARVGFEAGEPVPSDLEVRFQIVLQRLRAAGFSRCVAVNLTRADLGVPVVRILVPGAAGPYGHSARRPSARLLRHLV
jgi:ribosomal protein S12 methylthiotransferase accessory factor